MSATDRDNTTLGLTDEDVHGQTPSGGTLPRARRHSEAEDAAIRRFAIEAARTLHDSHCEDVVLLDVRGLSQVTDYVLIGTGTSDRQMRSVGGEVTDLAAEQGLARMGTERDERLTWLVLDFVDVVVHLFEPTARGHYDLEMLWGDAPRIPWRR